jgi:hypothetical protein
MVHPTNIFAATAIFAAFLSRWPSKSHYSIHGKSSISPTSSTPQTTNDKPSRLRQMAGRRWLWAAPLLALIGVGICFFSIIRDSKGSFIEQRFGGTRLFSHPANLPDNLVLYARIFMGGTVYRHIAGSRSWFEWPLDNGIEGWGLDVGIFWAAIIAAVWIVWRSWKQCRRMEDCGLIAVWAMGLAGFMLVGGPRAMSTGEERFTLNLIGPMVLLFARAATLTWQNQAIRRHAILAAASLGGWLILADFNAQYFQFIERTGGESTMTFRAAKIEPKQAALDFIRDKSGSQPAWIVCSQYWNFWPICYLAGSEPRLQVIREVQADDLDFAQALHTGRVWFVEFAGSEEDRSLESQFANQHIDKCTINDFSGRPAIQITHPKATVANVE